jgi:hypothetical protein
MTTDKTIIGGDLSISTTEQQATTDALLGRVRDRIIGNAGTSEIVEGMFLKAAIDVASNLPDDGVAVSDAAIQRAIRAEAEARRNDISALYTKVMADSGFPSGTKMLFRQSTAPTGWTKDTAHNDKALRVVSGSAGSGGNIEFSQMFNAKAISGSVSTSISGSVAGHALSISQIPSHNHNFSGSVSIAGGHNSTDANAAGVVGVLSYGSNKFSFSGQTSNRGIGAAHSHGWSGSADSTFRGDTIDMRVRYVDVIIATKD